MENTLRNFSFYFPTIAESMRDCHEGGPFELIVTCDDGTKILYNDMYGTIRRLPASSDSLDEDDFKREFAYRLRDLMLIKNVTQKELSERTGINTNNISRYVNGKNVPSFYAVDRIAKALGCSTDVFRYLD